MTRMLTAIGLLVVAWSIMTTTHEIGHVVGGWCGGATLTKFSIAPWRLPFSLHSPDPNPRLTLWAGPLLGTLGPFCVAAAIRRRWAWFVADFCMLANGCYLALAWISGERFLDTPRMLAAGVAPATIATYCAMTISLGYVRFRADCVNQFSPRTIKTSDESDS
ncbi:hypothetical protein [Rubripirellula reticaptiva]|uniref:MraY-like glycosyltransferase n=1 Tax=Rubripirellula reticaptiva TaxID=2528013 RepID=A0A5C6EX13_9BACT|nr:hypothetical protein [Rubripirellula reticaptiva]TWU51999.1 hypothetical protein Poly59_35960 [Rubripirellula reticaptiva]